DVADGQMIQVRTSHDTTIEAVRIADNATTDLAILQTRDYQSEYMVTLCDCEITTTTEWACHGHPNTVNGNAMGTSLQGTIAETFPGNTQTEHDISLAISGVRMNSYSGFSGSGVINSRKEVIAILTFQNDGFVSAVSIRKAVAFLRHHNVSVTEDELEDFTCYIEETFTAFEDPMKGLCLRDAGRIATQTTPQLILDTLRGTLYFPEKPDAPQALITELRQNIDLNNHLWKGWLKLLTYVSLIKGQFADVNKITITINSGELVEMMGTELVKMDIKLTLTLRFLFSEQGRYFDICKQYMIDKSPTGELGSNHCHIFNSPLNDWGGKKITPKMKNDIVYEITSPMDAGMVIPGKIDFGVISLQQLTHEMISSQDLTEATKNIETLFRNAIS
ncbi:MAG TPA: hypothetical protein VGM63_08500, partial [Mucilaginibacter sp.]